jgi:hypothetical protein
MSGGEDVAAMYDQLRARPKPARRVHLLKSTGLTYCGNQGRKGRITTDEAEVTCQACLLRRGQHQAREGQP